ncbi:hypothetical protein HYV81_01860 [Candidatus Woesearchaeota archaeon]|nr:hypothetical protein [Candidatus Woesearchaeota archaeon]
MTTRISSIESLAADLAIRFDLAGMTHYGIMTSVRKVAIAVKDAEALLRIGLGDIIVHLSGDAYPTTTHVNAPFCTVQDRKKRLVYEYDLIEWRLREKEPVPQPITWLGRAMQYLGLPVHLGYSKS